ncbi:adenylate/guanylate cyclase domain-containing protein [Oceanibacterium hippocampi]|uniref:Adenylate cyclase 2 n=1 Tax=Oceanibacterium hippocampi TaxID=745714 RepID=A0A1Y5TYI6_9PROT|nr:adenylate/guanylate cyclase domain-containing protein [Oceanibacterium hippocampi]SLN71292.1 Adenylate cyclase 2 [Oceanibacterium hippocampi]
MNVGNWLAGLGLEQYAEAFAANGVDLDLLPELTNEDLKDLGVVRLMDRKTILKAIASLSESDDKFADGPTAPAIGAGERRQVTVLFADIAGYTRLSSELGAEKTHALLNRYFEVVDGIVADYGGSIDKHMGDNVMAVFGAPTAHDDDPLRAVRVALDIHERMATLSNEVGRPLQAHIGLASGQVVASGTGSDAYREYTVTGDSVNLASRLQERAEAGETLISDALRQAVAGHVECDSLGDVAVRGIEKPVRVWRVVLLRGIGDTSARIAFVGRGAELAQFTAIVENCRASGNGQAIVVRGEAGIGKSRLVEEFTRVAAEQGFATHRGLVLDFGVGKGQDAIRSIVRSILRIPPGGSEAALREAAEAAVADRLLASGQRVFLNDLLYLPQPVDVRATYDAMDNATRIEGKRKLVADLLRRASADAPVTVIVEDVHWAAPLMLTYLARMAATVTECPAVLVMTSRIEGDPLDEEWRGQTGGCPLVTIDLGPLRRNDALIFANSFFDTSTQLALSCVERAEGNPLFLEQLLRNAEEESGGDDVPASIQSLVLARMDRLSPADKEALQAASVLGQRFSLDALRHLTESPSYRCDQLLARHLFKPEREGYLFAHALVQEGVYASLLTSRRVALHRAAAAWYGQQDPALRAEHLDRAGDKAAAAAYLEAARTRIAALHFETALSLTGRGIELVDDAATRFELMCLRGDSLRNVGSTEESIAAFESARDSAEDDVQRCRAWVGMAKGLRVADRQEAALEALDKAEAAATEHGLLSERGLIHYLRGNVYFPLGNIDGCLEEHEKAVGFAREVGSTKGEALALGGLGDAYYLRGYMRTAFEQFGACVKLCREHGYRRIEVANRHMVGWTRIYLMEFPEALEDALESVEMAAEVRHRRAELLGLMLAGRVELELGRFGEAREYLRRALDLARTLSAGNFEAQSLVLLARLGAAEGQMSEARDFARRAVAVVRKVGMTFIGPTVLAVGAALTDDPAERRQAMAEAESILDAGCVAHNHFWFGQSAVEQALVLGEWDEAERYATRLEAYTRAQPLPWPDFTVARGRALAAWGRGGRGPELVATIERLRDEAMKGRLMPAVTALDEVLKAA